MAKIDLTAENFNDVIYDNDTLLIDFFLPTCPASQAIAPILDRMSEKHPDIAFGFCNLEVTKEVIQSFGLKKTPTFSIFRQQELVFQQAGVPFEDELDELLSKAKALDMPKIMAELEAKEEGEGAKDEPEPTASDDSKPEE